MTVPVRKAAVTIVRHASRLMLLLLLAGCATFEPPLKRGANPSFVQPDPLPPERPGVALVLSGGAARGYAHIGVIKVLEAEGLRPDIVVGSSAGSIVGALYASGLSADELERALSELGWGSFNDWVLPGLGFLPGAMGFIKGEKLRRFVLDRVKHDRIEDFPIRFGVVCTDLRVGTIELFNAGEVSLAVLASSAIPGIVNPVEISGRLYGDGQISSPVPVQAARRLGAKRIIAVDVIYPPDDAFLYSAPSVVFQWPRNFSDLYEKVDGLNLHEIDLQLSCGERPDLEKRRGKYRCAASFVFRKFDGAALSKPPGADKLAWLATFDPDAYLMLYLKHGRALAREMKWLGSHRYAVLNLGADSEPSLETKYEMIKQALEFETVS